MLSVATLDGRMGDIDTPEHRGEASVIPLRAANATESRRERQLWSESIGHYGSAVSIKDLGNGTYKVTLCSQVPTSKITD